MGRKSKGFVLVLNPNRVERLVDFLSREMQPYRASLMLQYRAIDVQRGSWTKTITNPEFMVRPDDFVLMAEPPPKEFLASLARLDSKEFFDYAVSIGRGDKFDQLMSQCLEARPQTVNMGSGIKSIHGFLTAFGLAPSVSPHPRSPVRDLILATHASQEGFPAVCPHGRPQRGRY